MRNKWKTFKKRKLFFSTVLPALLLNSSGGKSFWKIIGVQLGEEKKTVFIFSPFALKLQLRRLVAVGVDIPQKLTDSSSVG